MMWYSTKNNTTSPTTTSIFAVLGALTLLGVVLVTVVGSCYSSSNAKQKPLYAKLIAQGSTLHRDDASVPSSRRKGIENEKKKAETTNQSLPPFFSPTTTISTILNNWLKHMKNQHNRSKSRLWTDICKSFIICYKDYTMTVTLCLFSSIGFPPHRSAKHGGKKKGRLSLWVLLKCPPRSICDL